MSENTELDKVNQITKFVEKYFYCFRINGHHLLYEIDEETDERIPIPLFPNGEIDDDILNRVSILLGLSKQEILDMDETTPNYYIQKYPFLLLYIKFLDRGNWYFRFKNKMDEFDHEESNNEWRYDRENVERRLMDKIKKIDEVVSGTYHKDATIYDLEIFTEIGFSFPECKEMLRSFIEMVYNLRDLFFKAINEEMSESEIKEMNFLASILFAYDRFTSDVLMTYDNVRAFRNLYIRENVSNFFEYAKIEHFYRFTPWRCYEFLDDMDLVQEYVNIYPEAKSRMREYAMDALNFRCEFRWSDATLNCIYVEKTEEEMYEWKEYAGIIADISAASSKGGLNVPERKELPTSVLVKRIQARLDIKNRGGLFCV